MSAVWDDNTLHIDRVFLELDDLELPYRHRRTRLTIDGSHFALGRIELYHRFVKA